MTLGQIIVLSVVQGLAELLPISSSAHVVVAEKLMGLNPSAPEMTLVLVMLHTGTMVAVIAYFWQQWRRAFFADAQTFKRAAVLLICATILTGLIGEALVKVIEHMMSRNHPQAEIEDLFSHLELIAPALLATGVLVFIAGVMQRRDGDGSSEMTLNQASLIGAVQGLCLPFRGFSRSGATISTGMLAGVARPTAETFSFALAVILTPPVIAREALRVVRDRSTLGNAGLGAAIGPSLIGFVGACIAGMLALKWLSRWLETGRWHLFGIYCVVAAIVVFVLHARGY